MKILIYLFLLILIPQKTFAVTGALYLVDDQDFPPYVYLNNEEYSKYITMIGNYIIENQGDMDLIPVNRTIKTSNHMANKAINTDS